MSTEKEAARGSGWGCCVCAGCRGFICDWQITYARDFDLQTIKVLTILRAPCCFPRLPPDAFLPSPPACSSPPRRQRPLVVDVASPSHGKYSLSSSSTRSRCCVVFIKATFGHRLLYRSVLFSKPRTANARLAPGTTQGYLLQVDCYIGRSSSAISIVNKPPSFPPSFPPSLLPSLPPCLPPSLPPSLPPPLPPHRRRRTPCFAHSRA